MIEDMVGGFEDVGKHPPINTVKK